MTIKSIRIAAILVGMLVVGTLLYLYAHKASAASFPDPRVSGINYIASSTAYALTWGATGGTRIIATSTTPGARISLNLQAINCGTNGSVFVAFNDINAATSTGYWINASSSTTFSDHLPMMYGSMRAEAIGANCSLLVNEIRSSL